MGSKVIPEHVVETLRQYVSYCAGPFLVSGADVYVGIGSAVEAVSMYRHRNEVILGFEGFRTDGRFLDADLDLVADLSSVSGSWDERVRRAEVEAIEILERWGSRPEFVSFVVARNGPAAQETG